MDICEKAAIGFDFLGISAHAILGGNINRIIRREKLNKLAEDIKKLLEKKKRITIPEIMKMFKVNALDAIEAINILKEKGIVKEVVKK